MLSLNFYDRHSLGGLARYAMLPVRWLTGPFVHCDVTIGDVLWTADMWRGVVSTQPSLTPSVRIELSWVWDGCATQAASEYATAQYSFFDFLTVALPDALKRDHPGLVCSEHAALVVQRACELSEPLSRGQAKFRCRTLADLLYATQPHRHTPTSLHRTVSLWNTRQTV